MNRRTTGRTLQFLPVLARLTVGGLFLWTGLDKAFQPAAFVAVVRDYRLLGDPWSAYLGITLPWLEAAVGLCLLMGFYTRPAAIAATGLLTGFSGVLLLNWGRELPGGCGCLPWETGAAVVGPLLLLRDLALLGAALVPALRPPGLLSLDAWLVPAPSRQRGKA